MTRMHDDAGVLPRSIDAEQAVLGGLMIQPAAHAKIADWISEDDFYRRDHRLIYRAISWLVQHDKPCDAVTLGEWIAASKVEGLVGDVSYVIELANSTPSAANIVAYAEIVAEKSRLRKAIDLGHSVATEAAKPGAEAGLIVANAMRSLVQLEASKLRGGLQPTKPLLRSWFAEMNRMYESGDRVTGMPTPWRELNEATRGMQDGELIVIAGRPNMGKSVAGLNIASFTALRGGRTAVFTLEMTARQVLNRCISAMGGIPYDWIRAPHQQGDSELYWPRITNVTTELLAAPLLIDEQPKITIEQLRARCLREHMRAPLRLVLVDHVHIMGRKGENEVRELGEISGGLKALAKELNCPVVALAQLNRGVESRTDKRPSMSDLRASGEIEQDADLILLLYRDDYYNTGTHLRGVVEMIVGKGRDVRSGQVVHLANRFDEMRLDDWEGALPEREVAPKVAGGFRGRFGGKRAASGDAE